jgi:hypothetical protein
MRIPPFALFSTAGAVFLLIAIHGAYAQHGPRPGAPEARPAVLAACSNGDTTGLQAALTRTTQALLDGIGTGDTAVWRRALAPDAVLGDENGVVRRPDAVLAGLGPLPPGFEGTIRLADPVLRLAGGLAVLSYDALEHETIHGQRLATRYHTTDTWTCVADGGGKRRVGEASEHSGSDALAAGWRLVASQTAVIPSEHVAAAVDSVVLRAYVGTYALADGIEYAVSARDGQLEGRRAGRPPEALFPLGCDRFFRRGATRGERVFRRGADGRVDAMIDRRDNNDLVWRRVE